MDEARAGFLMEFLSEDATYLSGGLALIAGGFLIALRLTQQGKYLVRAVVAFVLALIVLGVEWVWVTDNERIEEAVYGLGRAVARSDTAGVLERLTDDVQYVSGGASMPGEDARGMVRDAVSKSKFDFLRITHLETNAGGQSRRGTAEFQVLCGGSYQGAFNALNFGSASSRWSLGLQETKPHVWKVNRISPIHLPSGSQSVLTPGSAPPPSGERPTGQPRRRRFPSPYFGKQQSRTSGLPSSPR
ncbi:MAG: hypothetical protein NVSMB9_27760 [Isosphaeraceae bacterium]